MPGNYPGLTNLRILTVVKINHHHVFE